ncbi:hypothetical protein GGI00_000661 [Coemansia sp. RSA 2681]|nr:hypothetical protein GGI00_000661 [Coemansia sp. RSA 2681]
MMLCKISAVAALVVASVSAHMAMISPCPRYSPQGQNCPALPAGQSLDYSMSSPLGANEPLCKHTAPFATPAASWTAGQSVTVAFAPGGAPHGGGHCEFSLSYDGGRTFVVVYQVLGRCFGADQGTRQYSFSLPAGLPSSDSAVFAWTWVNAIGNREFYMNCADVAIKGGSAPYSGKQMTIANHNGYPTIPEFSGGYDTGLQYYSNATTITVSGSGSSSGGGGGNGSGGQYSTSSQTPVAHAPTYSLSAPAAPTVATSVQKSTSTAPVSKPYPTASVTPAGAYSMTPAVSSVPPAAYSTAPQAMTTIPGPVVPTVLPTPYSAPVSSGSSVTGSCSGSALRCSPSGSGYQFCLHGSWSPTYACAPGTQCKPSGTSIACDWP